MWLTSGDGWVTCSHGHRHWGVFGAAGLLLTRTDAQGRPEVMLQHRAAWTHQGDTWGVAGGARQPEESAWDAAVREAGEEVGLAVDGVSRSAVSIDEHGGWAYHTVVAQTLRPDVIDLAAAESAHETATVAWVRPDDVEAMRLHPGFRASWPHLRGALSRPTLLVDAANVVGSRPDGWWRDRPAATLRLLTRLSELARTGVPAEVAPWPAPPQLESWYPRIVVVIEGQPARRILAPDLYDLDPLLTVLRAEPGSSGDDLIAHHAADAVATAAPAPAGSVVAVTADRGLRERVRAQGADVVGPGWLLDLLDHLDATE